MLWGACVINIRFVNIARFGELRRIYHWFTSMRAGIYILGMIAGTLAFGSVVSIDVYHSKVFYLLLISLCVNTLLCSGGRLWNIVRSADRLPAPQNCSFSFTELVRGKDPVMIYAALERIFRSAGFKMALQESNGQYILRGERGLLGAWGVWGAHVSIVLIAVGVLYGAYAGFDTTVMLTEGSSHTIRPGSENSFVLHFNKFSTSYYEDGAVSDWISDVTVERNGQTIAHQDIKVNHPLDFDGVKVYLASQGVSIQTRVLDNEHRILGSVEVASGDKMILPGTADMHIRILHYIPDYDPSRPMLSKSLQSNNPHIIYAISRDGAAEKRKAAPLHVPQLVDGESTLVMFSKVLPVVGLHVKYDPGLPYIWGGFGLLVFGICFCYYTPHRQLWVRILPENDGVRVVCCGRGSDLEIVREKIRCCLTGGSVH